MSDDPKVLAGLLRIMAEAPIAPSYCKLALKSADALERLQRIIAAANIEDKPPMSGREKSTLAASQ